MKFLIAYNFFLFNMIKNTPNQQKKTKTKTKKKTPSKPLFPSPLLLLTSKLQLGTAWLIWSQGLMLKSLASHVYYNNTAAS